MRGPEHLGKVLVLGLGKSGKSVARYCAGLLGTRVDSLFIAAGQRTDDSVAFLESLKAGGPPSHRPEQSAGRGAEGSPLSARPDNPIGYAFGDDALAGCDERFDLCVASPGIPFWHELYVAGKRLSAELVSEVELAWRESAPDSTWVAITGTNGKTTTTSLCAHILRECGFAADAVGNIGDVCLDAVASANTQVYVAEVSSYQLASTVDFAPDVAVLLNVTPDHIHWHQTLDAYAQAKFKVLANMSGGVAILDATNDVVRGKVREMRAVPPEARAFTCIPIGTAEGIHGDMRAKCGADNAAFLDEHDVLHVALGGVDHALLPASSLQIAGEHNASNALAAAAVAAALGADDAQIAAALASFKPLAHRIEPCGSVVGAECYNDSKATNVDATLKALAAFPGRRVIVLLGGDDKGTDLAELVAATRDHTVGAVCYGEGGPRFFQALSEAQPADAPDHPVGAQVPAPATEGGTPQTADGFTCLMAAHLEDALDAALGLAQPGDVVLLSPACASFDEFRSFEHRGDVFKQLVAARAEALGA